jgi:COP9 signalosome complex subunit 6
LTCICHVQLVLINISDHHTRLKANSPDGAPLTLVMGCLLGSQDGRAVDVANSFEIKFTEAVDGSFEIDTPFLLKKAEQCECFYLVCGWGGGGGRTLQEEAGWQEAHMRTAERGANKSSAS